MRLPEDLPPSLPNNNNGNPYIKYSLSIVLNRSWPYFDLSFPHRILVTPRVHIPRDVWFLQIKESNLKDLYISGILRCNYLLIGQSSISLELKIENPSRMTIERTIVALIQHRQFAEAVGNSIIFSHSLPDMIDFKNDHLYLTFQIPVLAPAGLFAPTSSYTRPGDNNRSWTVEYTLAVTFYTQAVLRNVTLEFPILVANSKC